MCERNFKPDKNGIILDDVGNEWRNEEGNIEFLELKPKGRCPKCGGNVYGKQAIGYFAQCFNCDEDFYKFEIKL